MSNLDRARAVVLVEGASDQVALETAARGRGRDLAAERVMILPIGGAHAIGRQLRRLLPRLDALRLAGLCDAAEEQVFRRSLAAEGDLGSFRTLQTQPAWRGRRPQAQTRRFLGSGAGRKLRYARLLVGASLDRDCLPPASRRGPRHGARRGLIGVRPGAGTSRAGRRTRAACCGTRRARCR